MTVVVSAGEGVDLEVVHRVAWHRESLAIAPETLQRVEDRYREFETFVAGHAELPLYGITTRHHYGAKTVLTAAARDDYHRRLPSTPPSVGPPMPERLVRAIIVARLASLLDGHGGVRAEVLESIAGMLEQPLPYVPERGHGEPGEIILLGHLFGEFQVDFGVGGGMPLVNGSPCAAAALADVALTARRRLALAEEVFALAAEAIRAPLEHYDVALERLWRDEHQAAALRRMRELLDGGAAERRPYQAPVSFRSTPRMLGWLRRLQAQGEECAILSLNTASGNPIFAFSEDHPPDGAVIHNGGYHNPLAAPLINAFARAWADLAQLAAHQVERLVEDPQGVMAAELESRLTGLYMTQTGWAEEARHAAQSTLISLGGVGQTDTATPDLLAWRLACEAGNALEITLATLAVVASHTIQQARQQPPRRLGELFAAVLTSVPVGAEAARIATGLRQLTEDFSRRVIDAPPHAPGASIARPPAAASRDGSQAENVDSVVEIAPTAAPTRRV